MKVLNIILLVVCALTFITAFNTNATTVFQQMYYAIVQGFAAVCFCVLVPKQ